MIASQRNFHPLSLPAGRQLQRYLPVSPGNFRAAGNVQVAMPRWRQRQSTLRTPRAFLRRYGAHAAPVTIPVGGRQLTLAPVTVQP